MQRTAAHLYRLDPATLQISRLTTPDDAMVSGFSFSADGKRVAFQAASADDAPRDLRLGIPLEAPAADPDDRAGRGLDPGHARGHLLEEQGRDGDRGRAHQAGRFRSGEEIRPAVRHPRRADGRRPAGACSRATRATTRRTSGPPAAPSSSRSTTGAAPDTGPSSASSTTATSASATPGTSCRASSISSRRAGSTRAGSAAWAGARAATSRPS